ncbi:MAG: hypothetical protein SPI65_07465 [Peptoniphilus sp.]|nr:hypothetical protein [Peptoniphilus sp.]MDD7363299.1 hypothetical protein [Bacillota bacterium]MDY6045394.1 hypothetical protein [Peptoniphilus sp.]
MKKAQLKMGVYAFVIGLACALLRWLIKPEIPHAVDTTVGVILLLIACVLTVVEVRKNFDFFYASAENWNGGGIVNSGALLGISNFFFSGGNMNGILSALLLAILLTVIRLFAGQSMAQKRR